MPLFANSCSVEHSCFYCSHVQVLATWCAITHQVRTTIFHWSKHYVLQLIHNFPPSAPPWPFIYPISRLLFVLVFVHVWIHLLETSLQYSCVSGSLLYTIFAQQSGPSLCPTYVGTTITFQVTSPMFIPTF